jgi:hypothetical protein
MTVTIIYVTDTFAAGVDRPLTAVEHDTNMHTLKEAIEALEADPPTANSISNVTVTGRQLRVYLEDGTMFGPFTLSSLSQVPATIATISATSHATVAANAGKYLRCTHASGCAVTLDGAQFSADDEIHFRQCGGALSFTPTGSDGVINTRIGKDAATSVEGAVVTAKYLGDDAWDLFGDLADVSA